MQSPLRASCTKQVGFIYPPPANVQNITLGAELTFLIDQRQEARSNCGLAAATGNRNRGFLQTRSEFSAVVSSVIAKHEPTLQAVQDDAPRLWPCVGHRVSDCSRVTGDSEASLL